MLQSTLSLPATLAVSALLLTNLVSSTPLKRLERQVVEDEYDFIICGGMFHLTSPSLNFPFQFLRSLSFRRPPDPDLLCRSSRETQTD